MKHVVQPRLESGLQAHLDRGGKTTIAADHGGIHLTCNGHEGTVASVILSAAEARELADFLATLAAHLDLVA